MKRTIAAALLLCPLLMLRAAEEKPAELSEADAARARKWAEQLSDAEFEVRDGAYRELQKLGPSAWPVLEPLLKSAEDAETAARLRKLAKAWSILLPDQQDAVKELLAKLNDPKDGQIRAAALDTLLGMGPAVVALVRAQFSAKGAKTVLKLESEQSSAILGQRVKFNVKLVNKGEGTFWCGSDLGRSSTGFAFSKVDTFGEVRPHVTGRGYGGGSRGTVSFRCGRSFRYVNPLLNWRPLAPGAEEAVGSDEVKDLPEIGLIEISYSRDLSATEVAAQVPETGEEVKLQMNSDIGKDDLRAKGRLRVFVLPDIDKKPEKDYVELKAQTDVPKAKPNEKWLISAALHSKREQGSIRFEKDAARYAWYVVVDEKGGVPKHGSWRTVAEGAETEVLAARTVAPGKSTEWKLAIPAPEKPGVYSVYLGYEMTQEACEIDGVTYPNYDEPALKKELEALKIERNDLTFYAANCLYTRIEELRVEGTPAESPRPADLHKP